MYTDRVPRRLRSFGSKAIATLHSGLLAVYLGTTASKKGMGARLRMPEGNENRFDTLGGTKLNLFTKFRSSDLVPSSEDFRGGLPKLWRSPSCGYWVKEEGLEGEFCDEATPLPSTTKSWSLGGTRYFFRRHRVSPATRNPPACPPSTSHPTFGSIRSSVAFCYRIN